MTLADAISVLDHHVANPSEGLPDELFYYLSRITPLVNVDLLIKDENGRTLLAWRKDQYAGEAWHVPGGIVRFKETFATRIQKVAEIELGTPVNFDATPIALNQLIHPNRDVRGHFISLLYRCSLPAVFVPPNRGLVPGDRGFLKWHDSCPDSLITYHEIYRKFI